jgi:hypothetical protein
MSGIGTSLKAAAMGTARGVASLTEAAGKSVEVAGKTTAKAVQVTGVVADKVLNVGQKGVEVGANVTMAGLNAAGTITKVGLQTATVATEAAGQITQAAARSTANASEATLKASANIVKSGVGATAKIANAALLGTAQVTTDTLKISADAASSAAKFSIGTVNSALKGLDNLRDLGSMTGQAWVDRVRLEKQENSKIASMRTPQVVLNILVKDFEKVAYDLRSSFKGTLSASDLSLKLLIIMIKDLYCMSFYRRMTKNSCPKNSQLRKTLQKKIVAQAKELDGKSAFFFKMFDQKLAQTLSLFKAESQKPAPSMKSEEEQVNQIKGLFSKKLDEFSSFVATQLTTITTLFETRSAQYQKIIDKAYEGVFATNGVFNAMSQPLASGPLASGPLASEPLVSEPLASSVNSMNMIGGARRRKTRKHKKSSKRTRKQ